MEIAVQLIQRHPPAPFKGGIVISKYLKMRFLIVDTYYRVFLDAIYAQNPKLHQQPYEFQWNTLMGECFGTADFYSFNLRQLGHEATEVVANCRPLQLQWAQEHCLRLPYKLQKRSYKNVPLPWIDKDWIYPVLKAQVKSYQPDIIHFQDPGNTDPGFVQEIRPYVRFVSAQIASPIPSLADFRPYDLMLSSFPHFVRRFQQQGLRSAYFNVAFEPRVLKRLKSTASFDVVFVGGLSPSHSHRIQFLEQVAQRKRIDWWGYGVESLASDSPLRKSFHESAWALSMYEKLFNARISLNHHIDVAENYANNMRIYEATGVGSLLITDLKCNLPELFELGKEVVAYRNSEECVELIEYYLNHEAERAAVAQAGQQRTLREHTYYHRMQEWVGLVKPLLS